MQRYVLNMGEMVVASNSGEIICYGLGSCIGVFLHDRFQKIGAGAHIALPEAEGECNATTSLSSLVNEMLNAGCNRQTIRAFIIGGANILNLQSFNIGIKNIEFVRNELKKARIMIKAQDVGGANYRTARLNVSQGSLVIGYDKMKYTI